MFNNREHHQEKYQSRGNISEKNRTNEIVYISIRTTTNNSRNFEVSIAAMAEQTTKLQE